MPVLHYDMVRGLFISLGALIFGMILFATIEAWRNRLKPPPPKRVPFPAVVGFSAGYLSLLGYLMFERWTKIGDPVNVNAYLALTALIVNVLVVSFIISHVKKIEDSLEVARLGFRTVRHYNEKGWRKKHPEAPSLPQRREQDRLPDLPDEELRDRLKQLDDG